jgi:hypothetical protein
MDGRWDKPAILPVIEKLEAYFNFLPQIWTSWIPSN